MKRLILFLLFPVLMYAQNTLDNNNTTSTNLGANGVYTGTGKDASASPIGNVSVFGYASHASATNGLKVQVSKDNTTYFDFDSASVSATSSFNLKFNPPTRYYRVKYTNGADSVTSFFIYTMYSGYPY